ncbi:hypothetical protein [Fictibacillus macauensis]
MIIREATIADAESLVAIQQDVIAEELFLLTTLAEWNQTISQQRECSEF